MEFLTQNTTGKNKTKQNNFTWIMQIISTTPNNIYTNTQQAVLGGEMLMCKRKTPKTKII